MKVKEFLKSILEDRMISSTIDIDQLFNIILSKNYDSLTILGVCDDKQISIRTYSPDENGEDIENLLISKLYKTLIDTKKKCDKFNRFEIKITNRRGGVQYLNLKFEEKP